MAINVVHNSAASVASRYLEINDRNVTRASTRLASGTRVVSARDDAASLAIGARLGVEVNALRQGAENTRQGISMLQIADGASARVSDILTRLKVLAVQAGSGQLSSTERAMLNTEFEALKSEIGRIAQATSFNGKGLVDDGGIVLTLRQLPTNGTLYLNGEELEINDTFSLADVQRGRVTYDHSGIGSTDGLVVSIANSEGFSLGTLVGEGDAEDYETAEYVTSSGLNNIHASTAYARGGTGSGVRVAVIDSGVDLYHTDLDGQIVDGVDIVDGTLEGTALTAGTTSGDGNDTNDGNASDGHGTHVAGIIAAERDNTGIMGVAYEADIIAIKATNPTGGLFDADDVADAIDYARLDNAKVINMSLSFGPAVAVPNQITAAMVRAINAGVVIVAATGNSTFDDPDFPASFAIDSTAQGALIAVAATDDSNEIASFSNRAGETKAFVVTAPGVSITSDLYNGATTVSSSTVVHSGTSMAAPHVAGAAAILTQLYGDGTDSDLSGAEIANLIFSTATDLGDEGTDDIYGRGLLNLDKATMPQFRLDINVSATSLASMSGQLNVVSGQEATLTDTLFAITDAYESFSSAPSQSLTFKVGSGVSDADELTVETQSISALALGISEVDITTASKADEAAEAVSEAIIRLSSARATIGAAQNRLEFAAANVDTVVENTELARSNLLDLDVAREMTVYTSRKLLQNMGISALAQAQQRSRDLLRLFN